MKNKELYTANETMEVLGYQFTIDCINNERFKSIMNVMKAYETYGNAFDRLTAINYRKSNSICLIWDIFMLGMIYGKREEREKKNK